MRRPPLAWALVAAATAIGVAMTFSYLGAFLDPLGNARGLPVVIVDEDTGSTLGSRRLELGGQAIALLRSPRSPLGDAVAWTVLPSRRAALEQLAQDKAYAAVVIPPDYSRRLASLALPARGVPVAAKVEVLGNRAAGSFARSASEQLATRAVTAVSIGLAGRLAGAAPTVATRAELEHRVGDAIEVRAGDAAATGARSAGGLAPFYFALMLALTGFVGMVMISLGVEFLNGHVALDVGALRLHRPRSGLSRTALWKTKLLLGLSLAALAGTVQTAFAVEVLGMTATNPVALGFFAVLGVAATAATTLLFLLVFGLAGSLVGVLFITIFGVPSSGGPYPTEALPGFFRFLAEWLPLRYLTDGARSLVFLDGRLDAGLAAAIVVLAAYLAVATAAGAATALAIDRRLRRNPLHAAGDSGSRRLHDRAVPSTSWIAKEER